MSEKPFIAVSGGFDPLHIGHVRMIDDAAAFGNVIVLLNSDDWLVRKKGRPFMPFAERKEILESIRNVHCVLPALDEDDTVCQSLEAMAHVINYFGNGGDRFSTNTPEADVCAKREIGMIFGLGGGKIQSSSRLVQSVERLYARETGE